MSRPNRSESSVDPMAVTPANLTDTTNPTDLADPTDPASTPAMLATIQHFYPIRRVPTRYGDVLLVRRDNIPPEFRLEQTMHVPDELIRATRQGFRLTTADGTPLAAPNYTTMMEIWMHPQLGHVRLGLLI